MRSWRPTDPEDRTGKAVNLFMLVLVVLNVAAVVLETVESIYLPHKVLFHYFADASVIIFTIEYILRIWSYGETQKGKEAQEHPRLEEGP